jgi:hypothetical protein
MAHSLKAPGFNPCTFVLDPAFAFSCNLCRYDVAFSIRSPSRTVADKVILTPTSGAYAVGRYTLIPGDAALESRLVSTLEPEKSEKLLPSLCSFAFKFILYLYNAAGSMVALMARKRLREKGGNI